MRTPTYRDMLNAVAFIFTIILVIYAVMKGTTITELSINIAYFLTLILSQLENIKEIFLED